MLIPPLPAGPARLRVCFLLVCSLPGTGAHNIASAQGLSAGPPPAQLPALVTTATRTAAARETLGTATDSMGAAELTRRQIASFADALRLTAGTPRFASGAAGATTALFLRGANSNQTLFLVDGIRLNDPNTNYEVFLGGACVSACDSLEIAHGPQSTLYGGEAVGGVVSLRAERGAGVPTGRVAFEAGSFGTRQGAVSSQGERGATAWNVSAQGGRTENERPNNQFESANVTLRLDHQMNSRADVGGTLRWFHGVYGDPGDRYTNDPDNASRESNLLATSFATLQLATDWQMRAVIGGQVRRFVSENPRPNGTKQVTVVKNHRGVLDVQSSFTGWSRHRLTAGTTAEANHTRNTGFGAIDEKQTLFAVFLQDEFSPVENVFLTAGVRNDDFDTFGRATTGRATAAWLLARRRVKLRASYGTAFRSPSFLDLYGQSAFYQGNPQLDPERARSWDAGVDFYLAPARTLSLTWFETGFRDLIASTPDFRSVENIQRARTRGLEVSAAWRVAVGTDVRLAYSYLEADNLTAGLRLLRRPRHGGSVDVVHDFGPRVSAGIGAAFAAQREDVHARTFARVDHEDFVVVRAHAAWQVSSRLALKARLENLLDAQYEEVNGYPALGFGGFAGLEWRF